MSNQTLTVQKRYNGALMYDTRLRMKHGKQHLKKKNKKLQYNNHNKKNKITNKKFQLNNNRNICNQLLNPYISLLRLLTINENSHNNVTTNTSFDAKTQNKKTFNVYYENMANTAKDPNHPKLQMLLRHLNNDHKIGVDVGAGTGHVSDYITLNKPSVSTIFCVDLDDKFIECINKLNNEKNCHSTC